MVANEEVWLIVERTMVEDARIVGVDRADAVLVVVGPAPEPVVKVDSGAVGGAAGGVGDVRRMIPSQVEPAKPVPVQLQA